MLMPNDDKVINNVDISVYVGVLHYCEKHVWYSHNNTFAGRRMGRHIKLYNYMLEYALGPYELVLSYGLGYGLGCRLGYE